MVDGQVGLQLLPGVLELLRTLVAIEHAPAVIRDLLQRPAIEVELEKLCIKHDPWTQAGIALERRLQVLAGKEDQVALRWPQRKLAPVGQVERALAIAEKVRQVGVAVRQHQGPGWLCAAEARVWPRHQRKRTRLQLRHMLKGSQKIRLFLQQQPAKPAPIALSGYA